MGGCKKRQDRLVAIVFRSRRPLRSKGPHSSSFETGICICRSGIRLMEGCVALEIREESGVAEVFLEKDLLESH